MKKFLVFLAFICAGHLQAQDINTIPLERFDTLLMELYSQGKLDLCLKYAEVAVARAKKEPLPDSIYANYLGWLGHLYTHFGQYAKSEKVSIEAMATIAGSVGEDHQMYISILNNLAIIYKKLGYYEKAEPLYLKAIEISKRKSEAPTDYAFYINNLAGIYEDMQNYEKAELLYVEAAEIYARQDKNSPYYSGVLNNLAGVYKKTGQVQKAEQFYLEAIRLKKEEKDDNKKLSIATDLNNLAQFYSGAGKDAEAETLYLEALAVWEKTLGKNHPNYYSGLSNLAVLYSKTGKYEKSKACFLEALDMRKKLLGNEHLDVSNSLIGLGRLYLNTNKLELALEKCLESIDVLSPDIDSSFFAKDANGHYTPEVIKKWHNLDKFSYNSTFILNKNIDLLLDILWERYQQTQNPADIELYYQVVQAAIRLNERIRNDFSSEADKLRSLATNSRYVLSAIETALKIHKDGYEKDAFSFAEMNKAVLLMDASKTERAYSFGEIPDSLATMEKELQKKQARLKAQLSERHSKKIKDSLLVDLNQLNLSFESFTKSLKKQYPKYAQIKFENKVAEVTELQKKLNDNAAILEYTLGDSSLFIFFIDKKQVKLQIVDMNPKLLKTQAKRLHESLSQYERLSQNKEKAFAEYTEIAYWFFDKTLREVLKSAGGIKHLIVIPDAELSHLPFEVFLMEKATKNGDYSKLKYLLTEYCISYNYSATLWKENMEYDSRKNNGELIAMAANYQNEAAESRSMHRLPVYRNMRDALSSLPAARKEVEALQSLYKGFFAFDSLACEQTFKEKATDYAIIHLAMHGLLDEKHPILSSLAFTEDGDSVENNFLQAYEISKMELNADLVVLSACETGYGKFEKGNGTASLARAFMYAGVPAMVVSLWQVNDASTSAIMQLFYKNLAKGLDKAEALRQAKLTYIQSVDGMSAHPAFWAPFVQLGDSRPIVVKAKGGGLSMWWVGGGLLAVVAVGGGAMALRRRRRES